MNLRLHKPIESIKGKIILPGSKSISNRVLLIKALSGLTFTISNLSDSDDTKHLLKALNAINSNTTAINVGHAGTDLRFLTSFLAIQEHSYELTGSEQLQQRPIKDLVDTLRFLGADINYTNKDGYPPIKIKGKKLNGGKASIPGNVSSQFISSLLLIAPYLTYGLELTIEKELVSKPYVLMTVSLMKEFGASVTYEAHKIIVEPIPYTYTKNNYTIECDWSAASYFYSLVALSKPYTQLILGGLSLNSIQADSICIELYKSLGVDTTCVNNELLITKNTYTTDASLNYDFINCPDIAQTVVCTCIALNRSFTFRGLQTLKIKETDRLIALKSELEKLNYFVLITPDTIEFRKEEFENKNIHPVISTYHDHRMAMAFAPLCLLYQTIDIKNAAVVSKSFPLFWEQLKEIGCTIKTIS